MASTPKVLYYSVDEFIEALEAKAQESRDSIGKTRTKIESNEAKGATAAFNEAIYMAKALGKGLEAGENPTPDQVESVA